MPRLNYVPLAALALAFAVSGPALLQLRSSTVARARTFDDDPNFLPASDAAAGEYVVVIPPAPDSVGPADPSPAPGKPGAGSTNAVASTEVDYPVSDQDWSNPPNVVVNQQAVDTANSLVTQYGGTLVGVGDAVGAFAVHGLSESQARLMSHDPRVLGVVANYSLHADAYTTQSTPSFDQYTLDEWALDRIDSAQRAPRSLTFSYNATGVGVDAYVMDSGIRVDHAEFGGRALLSYSGIPGESPMDKYGHGTEVASAIGGQYAGPAKDVTLHSVRVLDRNGNASIERLVFGYDYIAKHGHTPGVVNCSFGVPKAYSYFAGEFPEQQFVEYLIKRGFTVVVSAGNNHDDANNYSPACVGKAITVGALAYEAPSNASDHMASYSNYGSTVDLFAPGQQVFCADYHSSTAYKADDGTSLAAPLVAGVVAQYLQNHQTASPASVQSWLVASATQNTIAGQINTNAPLPRGTPNKVLYTNQ